MSQLQGSNTTFSIQPVRSSNFPFYNSSTVSATPYFAFPRADSYAGEYDTALAVGRTILPNYGNAYSLGTRKLAFSTFLESRIIARAESLPLWGGIQSTVLEIAVGHTGITAEGGIRNSGGKSGFYIISPTIFVGGVLYEDRVLNASIQGGFATHYIDKIISTSASDGNRMRKEASLEASIDILPFVGTTVWGEETESIHLPFSMSSWAASLTLYGSNDRERLSYGCMARWEVPYGAIVASISKRSTSRTRHVVRSQERETTRSSFQPLFSEDDSFFFPNEIDVTPAMATRFLPSDLAIAYTTKIHIPFELTITSGARYHVDPTSQSTALFVGCSFCH